jgi:hypothetical protein
MAAITTYQADSRYQLKRPQERKGNERDTERDRHREKETVREIWGREREISATFSPYQAHSFDQLS